MLKPESIEKQRFSSKIVALVDFSLLNHHFLQYTRLSFMTNQVPIVLIKLNDDHLDNNHSYS